jgi:MtN3 and saliva related transmembrane protein
MGWVFYVGSAAALCTTTAFIPQIIKIRRQGGKDLSYPMLFLYLAGVLLWLVYGFLLHAAAVIWANALTSFLVIVALVLKLIHAGEGHRKGSVGRN